MPQKTVRKARSMTLPSVLDTSFVSARPIHEDSSSPVLASSSSSKDTWLASSYINALSGSDETLITNTNELVSLLKNQPSLAHDLAIPSMAPQIHSLLLSHKREVVACGYRLCTHLVISRDTAKSLLALRVDFLLMITLCQEDTIAKEHALKLVRKLVEYDMCPVSIGQALAALAELTDDKLRFAAVETLLEVAWLSPKLLAQTSAARSFITVVNENGPLSALVASQLMLLVSSPRTRHLLAKFKVSYVLPSNDVSIVTMFLCDFNGLVLFAQDDFRALRELVQFLPLEHKFIDCVADALLKVTNLQYKALLISCLVHCGLIESLVSVIVRDRSARAHSLMAELFALSRDLVPIESLNERVFNNSLSPIERTRLPFSNELIYQETMKFAKVATALNKGSTTLDFDINVEENINQYSRQVKNSQLDLIDEGLFKQMVFSTQVLSTKVYPRWNWNVIMQLLSGPLMNGKKLEELARTTKFVRRLLVFYRPLRHRFSNVSRKAKQGSIYVAVGVQFVKTLLSSSEGVRLLTDDNKMLPQLQRSLASGSNGIFTKERLDTTIVSGYFKMLGAFTKFEMGVKLLTQYNFLNRLYRLVGHPGYDEITMLMLPELDYASWSHCRILLSKALTSASPDLRAFATRLLGEVLESSPQMLPLLINQLYDTSPEVVATADSILYTKEYITPNVLKQLEFIDSPSCYKLMETSDGFRMLHDSGFVDRQREKWQKGKDVAHAKSFEQGEAPRHFYQYLAKSEDGVHYISRTGDLIQFVNTVRKFSMTSELEDIWKLKAAMWSIAGIGSTPSGVVLVDSFGVVEDLVKIFNSSQELSIRACAFYCLGLIAKTHDGIEILDELQWTSKLNVTNSPVGIALPHDFSTLLALETPAPLASPEPPKDEPEDDIVEQILASVSSLGNHLLSNQAISQLTYFKSTYSEYFEQPIVFTRTMDLLTRFKFKPSVRKFVCELFDHKTMRSLVKS